MKYYIVVEGKCGERKVYPAWLSYLNKSLVQTFDITDKSPDTYYLVSGNGYPHYFRIIDNAINDVNQTANFDFLIVAVDSEENSLHDKYNEIYNYINGKLTSSQFKIIIQHPCLETWALGNQIVFRRHPHDEKLRQYIKFFDVRTKDSSFLPAFPPENLNRAQFAFSYLKTILSERYKNLIYTKSNPKVIMNEKYFEQIRKRYNDTGHIASFQSFLSAFSI